jgi:hypothetical protein
MFAIGISNRLRFSVAFPQSFQTVTWPAIKLGATTQTEFSQTRKCEY